MSKYPTEQLPNGDVIERYNDNAFRILYNINKVVNMGSPVICNHCGVVYDIQQVKSIHRFTDCDVFVTPCCKRRADTRTYKEFPDYSIVLEQKV